MNKVDSIYVSPNYGLETLTNGNVSECIRYFRELLDSDVTGIISTHVGAVTVIEEMTNIKAQFPEKYKYILDQIGVYRNF